MSVVCHIGTDETGLRKGHEYVTAVHDLAQNRLLYVPEGRDHLMMLEAFT
jgi:hypothetical protein